MSKTKRVILRESMSVRYCGETRFDYLDAEEKPLIYKAMQIYADQEAIAYANWLSHQIINGETVEELYEEYKSCNKEENIEKRSVSVIDVNDCQKVLSVLRDWGKSDGRCDGYWYGYNKLQNLTSLGYGKLQAIIQQLKSEGLVEWRETYDDDGKFNGSGWFLSEKSS